MSKLAIEISHAESIQVKYFAHLIFLQHLVFLQSFHGIDFPGIRLLNQSDFSECTFSDNFDRPEVICVRCFSVA